MSLTNYIKTGQPLDAPEVAQNFTDLMTLANDIKAKQIVDRTIDEPALSGTWKSVQSAALAGPVNPTGADAAVFAPAAAFTIYSGEPVVVMVSGQVEFNNSPAKLELELRTSVPPAVPAAEYKLVWEGGPSAPVLPPDPKKSLFAFHMPLVLEKTGASLDVELWSIGATANWELTNLLIEVLGVNR